MSALEPVVQATRYTVNCLPADAAPDAYVFALRVDRKRDGLWVVSDDSRTLRADGTWSDEYGQHGYGAAYRHDLDTALELAKQAAPHVVVNGLTPATALARIDRLKAAEEAHDDRDFCTACAGTVDTCVCSDLVTPHPSQL